MFESFIFTTILKMNSPTITGILITFQKMLLSCFQIQRAILLKGTCPRRTSPTSMMVLSPEYSFHKLFSNKTSIIHVWQSSI